MNPLRIAFFPIIRTTFDVPLANEMIEQAHLALHKAGFELCGPAAPISDITAAQAAAAALDPSTIDLILVFQATFADSTLVSALIGDAPTPLFLWGIPEPWSGGRLRLNSLCGINLAGHALTLRKHPYHFGYGAADDPAVLEKIRAIAQAGSIQRRLQAARLGVVGEHPDGLDSCRLDDTTLQQTFGVQIRKIELGEVFTRARATTVPVLDETRQSLDARLDNLSELEQKPLMGTLSVYHALKEIAAEEKLAGLAVRCWPEFFTELGCAACGAMSLLSDGFCLPGPLPCSCEADINGTLTQLILQWLAGAPAFGTDMVGVDQERNRIALWHCGLAPLSYADPNEQPHGTIHSNRRLPLVMDFVLKPGVVTVARISQATGTLRLVLGRGEILAEPKPFNGTSGTLKLDCPAEDFLNLLMHEGLEHHVSLVYGDHRLALLALADLLHLPVLELALMEIRGET